MDNKNIEAKVVQSKNPLFFSDDDADSGALRGSKIGKYSGA
jgi:hypothetical protein